MLLLPQIAIQRSQITASLRQFFANQNFLEVETPILTPIPGMEPHLSPFATTLEIPHHETTPLYLNTSPELQMKKLLGAQFPNIFNLTKVFRNGEINSLTHNPEFTMLEWYRQNATYENIMNDCENLIRYLAQSTTESPEILIYQDYKIDLSTPFLRISTEDLFQQHLNLSLEQNLTFEAFKTAAQAKNLDTEACLTWDDIFFKLFLNHIEPTLGFSQPTIVYDYPATQAALAKRSQTNPFFAERFELYIAGIELANAFSELIDPEEQRLRLQEEQKERQTLNKTVFDIDEEFLDSLKYITKPCAGIALGLDRLIMLLTDKKSINDVLLFPLNKMLKL